MEQLTHVAGWVDRLDDMAVDLIEQSLRAEGLVGPPMVHILVDGLDLPYVGYLACRPMYRGADAAQAVRAMGVVGSMLGASRLVVTFENADLRTALGLPDLDGAATGLVVVDAAREGHTVRWHPATLLANPTQPPVVGEDQARAVWGPTSISPRGLELPDAVVELLAAWRAPREWSDAEVVSAFAGMEVGGYAMRWVQRPEGERGRPSWMRLLAPIM